MSFIILFSQIVFVSLMLCITALFIIAFALSWSRAQAMSPQSSLLEIVTNSAVEWGAWVSLFGSHLRVSRSFNEAPPYTPDQTLHPRQIPVILIPSLHSSSRIFNMLSWRLKKNFFTNIWVFSWKSFLKDEVFMRKTLLEFIEKVLDETKSRELHLISFGSSRPVISELLTDERLRDLKVRWIAISAPAKISPTLKFISTDRLQSIFTASYSEKRSPDLLIRGSQDFFCYPDDVWGSTKEVVIDPMGHYSTLLHSTTLRTILDFFEIKYGHSLRHG